MKKYVTVKWPEIQDYMNRSDYPDGCYYDSQKDTWLIPEEWEYELVTSQELDFEMGSKEYFDAHDCYDAIGGDWKG